MSKQWEVCEADEERIKEISEKFNINKIVATIIVNKGLSNSKIPKFLTPKRNDFYDPFLLPDMEKAVNRIVKAMDNKEKTIIYGDYDVDGITSSTVLKKFFTEREFETDVYIPNRLDEGYGLNENAIKEIAEKGYKLIITVDCGITAKKEVDLAKSLGIDVIITDHHEPSEEIPDAIAVVDAKRKDNNYPFNGLAGVGVAFKTIQAVSIKLNLPEETYLKYLDIVCVGTISDIVPLEDENRVISKLGLMLVNQTRNIGLKTLIKSTDYKNIDSTTISFGIAPRINACGRMGDARKALELFLTENYNEAMNITEVLNNYNRERQDVEKKIFEDAVLLAKDSNDPCIVVGKEGWHHGVIGIVSSKITDMYAKPSILLCYEDGEAKGSGRSIKGFDLHEALEKCSSNLEQFGGHNMAVGLTLKQENVEKFREELNQYAIDKKIEEIVPILKIDGKFNLKDVTVDSISELDILQPYGEANKMPIFQINNLKIESIRTLSEGKHLKVLLKDDENKYIDGIGFNFGHLAEEYKIGMKIDVVGNLEINEFNGSKKVQICIRDLRNAI